MYTNIWKYIYMYILTYHHIYNIYAFSICLLLCMLFMPMYKYIAWYSMNHACIFSICWASPLSLSPAALVVWVALALVATARVQVAQHEHEKRRWRRKLALNNDEHPWSKNMQHRYQRRVSDFHLPLTFCATSVPQLHLFAQFWASKERFWTCSLKELWKAAPSWTWSWRLRNHEPTKLDENRGKDDTWGMDMIKNHQKPLAFWAADFWCCHTCNLVAQLGRKMMKDEGQEINLIQFG